jgi:Uma2 family endonuclease
MKATTLEDPDVEGGVYYPSSDGKPMAETYLHVLTIRFLLDALEDAFASRDDVFIAGNVNWFWEQGNPRRKRAPDAMVVFGVEKGPRRSFRSWNEGGAVPAVCFEMASARTWRANLGPVKDDYEAARVREYFVFDPTREYLEAPIVGYRLRGRRYQRVPADEDGAMVSRELGLRLVPEGTMLRLVRLDTGERVLTRAEQTAAQRARADANDAAAAAERARADALAEEVARLKAELRASRRTNGSAK